MVTIESTISATGKDVEELQLCYIAAGHEQRYSTSGRVWQILIKLSAYPWPPGYFCNLSTTIYSYLIHIYQKSENTQYVLLLVMDKLWYIRTMKYYSSRKEEQTSNTCSNLAKEDSLKYNIANDLIYVKFLKRQNYAGKVQNSDCQRLR